MKHAILITAYKQFEQLKSLINAFDEKFNIYIHIDKKSEIDQNTITELLKTNSVKFIEKKYIVNWGGLNHLKSYLFLSEMALKNSENKYFHLISGQDYPIKDKNYFNNLLINNCEEKLNYLEYRKLPATGWKNGGMHRLEYYNFYDIFNFKRYSGKKIIKYAIKIQKKINFKRPIKFTEQLFGGSTYWTLSRNTLQYVIDFTKQNPLFFNRFKYTECAEEVYFQTVIMNSKHANNIVNDNLRFIDWESGKGGYPAVLDEQDFDNIVKSNKLFARKIDSSKNSLLEMLASNRCINQ